MTEKPKFDRRMLDTLICPQCQGLLEYDAKQQELVSKGANLAFPIRNGIPIMLIDEARDLS
ncbi:Trm112 family protein [Cognatishimia sp. WU-CL00825]|uniref:Trm112 family protein n=1 Tax=Cognatishimia sp. WU-CL00825 TaxID=3127658 RepID=UPI003104E753